MRHAKPWLFATAALGTLTMIAVPLWASAGSGSDRLMDVTYNMTMHMPGMGAMPPRAVQRQVCMPAKVFDPQALRSMSHPHGDAKCSVEHVARLGSTVSYDVVCHVPQTVTNHTEIHLDGDGGFTGTAHTTMDANGHSMTIDGQYSAKRVGSCTYTPPASS